MYKLTHNPPKFINGIGEVESFKFELEIVGDSIRGSRHGYVLQKTHPELLAPILWGGLTELRFIAYNAEGDLLGDGGVYVNPSKAPLRYEQENGNWIDTTSVSIGACPPEWENHSCVIYFTTRSNGFTWKDFFVRSIGRVHSVRTTASGDKVTVALEEYEIATQ